jgi:hypothetical protein
MSFIEIERNAENTGNVTILAPPCECRECSQQYYTRKAQHWRHTRYLGIQEAAEAQDFLDKKVTQIRENQQYLRDAISKHGNTILGRWKKKSRARRTECLVRALPTIEERRWAIFNYHYQVPASKNVDDIRKTYLLPYLSLEDLQTDPMRLLSLLHHRAWCDLDEWILFDIRQTKTGWERGRLLMKYCPQSVVMYGPEYGKLADWDEDRAHRWDTVGYPRAQLAIEAQHILYSLLRDVVVDLIKGVEIESMSAKWDELKASSFRRSDEEESWSLFSNQAYCEAPTLDVDRLTAMALSRFAEAQDRLWLLQTDPAHVQAAITYHQNSVIGKTVQNQGGKKSLYSYIAHCLTYSTIQRVHDWHYVVEECRHLDEVKQRFQDNIHPGEPLPRKYSEAVSCLELLLRSLMLVRAKGLVVLIPKLRGFEQSFDPPLLDATGGSLAIPLVNRDTKEEYERDPLLWCLCQMTMNDDNARMATDAAMIFGFFEDLVAKAAKESARDDRIEASLLDELSELGAVSELWAAVRYQRPVMRRIEKDDALEIAPPRACWRQWAGENRYGPIESVDNDRESAAIRKLDSKRMPSGKKTKAWLDDATEARRALKEFWNYARSSQRAYLEAIHTSHEDIKMLLSLISFDLAPEYIAALQEEREAILKPRQPVSETKQDPYTLQSFWGPSASDTETLQPVPQKKDKQKTRGVPAAASETPAAEPPPAAEPCPTLAVQESHLMIFRGMYPAPGDRPGGGDIDWKKFVAAMADAGFTATQSSGSAVVFSNGEGRIVFHKPHPVAKINPVMLAVFGRRMTRQYHWQRQTFFPGE